MFKLLSHCLIPLMFWGLAVSDKNEEENYLLELTDETFEEAVATPDFMIVEFYASWCVHCHNLLPTFQEVAKQLREYNVTFAKLNIETETKTQAKYQITVLPGVRIFRRGVIFDYEGPIGESGPKILLEYFLKEKEKTWLTDNPVIQLTEENYDQITKTTDLILVDFYVNECMPCKRFEPHFQAAARRLVENDPPVLLGSIDVPKNIELAKRFGIKTDYPFLVMLRYGEIYNYTGPKEEEGLVEYMKKQAGPSSTFLESVNSAKTFGHSLTEPRGIGFFSSETSAEALKTFMKSGDESRLDLKLGHTTDSSVAKELSFPLNSVVIFHPRNVVTKYEMGYTIIHNVDEGETPQSLASSYQNAACPLVGQMTKDNHLRAYKYRPLLVAYYDVNWDFDHKKDTIYWHSLIADVAIKYKETNLAFAIANENDFPVDLRALGMSSWGEDVTVGLYAPGPRKYRLLEELTKDSLSDFIDQYFEGNLEPYYSSEIPPKKSSGPVKTIVGSTFSKMVYNPKANVVVLFCIPSLPKCKEASEWFLTAAKKFYKKDKTIAFGDINVELNDVPLENFKFDDLPTLFFSPEGSKGETDLVRIDPLPEDEIDLLGWLRSRAIHVPRDEL